MDKTTIEHSLITVVIIGISLFFLDTPVYGAIFASALFIGREHAQAEERYISKNGGLRYRTPIDPTIGALHPKYWKFNDLLDWLIPVLLSILSVIIFN